MSVETCRMSLLSFIAELHCFLAELRKRCWLLSNLSLCHNHLTWKVMHWQVSMQWMKALLMSGTTPAFWSHHHPASKKQSQDTHHGIHTPHHGQQHQQQQQQCAFAHQEQPPLQQQTNDGDLHGACLQVSQQSDPSGCIQHSQPAAMPGLLLEPEDALGGPSMSLPAFPRPDLGLKSLLDDQHALQSTPSWMQQSQQQGLMAGKSIGEGPQGAAARSAVVQQAPMNMPASAAAAASCEQRCGFWPGQDTAQQQPGCHQPKVSESIVPAAALQPSQAPRMIFDEPGTSTDAIVADPAIESDDTFSSHASSSNAVEQTDEASDRLPVQTQRQTEQEMYAYLEQLPTELVACRRALQFSFVMQYYMALSADQARSAAFASCTAS